MPYFGGKQRIAPRIVGLLPEHRHYVEPYCGGLSVLLAKAPSKMETANDLDGDIMTFWRVLRDQSAELERVCALTPHSRAEHVAAAGLEVDDLERARRVWVRLTQGRGNQLRSTGWRHYADPAGSSTSMPGYLRGYVGRLAPVAERLRYVSLECLPGLELIAKYGRHSDVLLYVDPPYLAETRNSYGYRHEMRAPIDHAEMLEALLEARAAVVLSGYRSALYAEALERWASVDLAASTTRGGDAKRVETIWCNREFREAAA